MAKVAVCEKCGKVKTIYARGLCNSCYNFLHKKDKVGTCVECGKTAKIASKGLCNHCYQLDWRKRTGRTRKPIEGTGPGICKLCGNQARWLVNGVCRPCRYKEKDRKISEYNKNSCPDPDAVASLTKFDKYVWEHSDVESIATISKRFECDPLDVRMAYEKSLYAYTCGSRRSTI